LLVPFTAKGQENIMDETFLYSTFLGVTTGVGLTSYTGAVSFYADRVDCEPYRFDSQSSSELNFLFGFKFESRMSRYLDISLSLLYESRSGGFEPLNYTEHVYVSDTKPRELASFRQDLNASLSILSINPMLKFNPRRMGKVNLGDFSILVGATIAFMASDEIEATETILEPSDLFYQNAKSKERTIYTGEIASKNSLLFDLKFGLGYGFMITDRIKLSPEVFYMIPLTKVNTENDWKISTIQATVSLSYGF